MPKKQYRLFYRDIEIGEIIQEGSDFPNVFGKFRPAAESHGGTTRDRIQQYIDYSVAADQLLQEGRKKTGTGSALRTNPNSLT